VNAIAAPNSSSGAGSLTVEPIDNDTRFGLLLDAAHRHQQLVDTSLDRLEAHTRGLDTVVRDVIRRTLVSECTALDAEIASAAAALQSLRRVASLRLASWSVAVMTAVAGALLLVLGRVLPSARELTAMRAQRDEMSRQIQQLYEAGARVDLRRCGNEARLCVRVDRSAPSYGSSGDYLVLKGY
jgi:hypothetical protein